MALAGSVAVISGVIGDIGRAIALELARRGADIAGGDVVGEADAAALRGEVARLGRRFRYDRVDVADDRAVDAWIAAVEADLGPADLVIPNAAVVAVAHALELSADSWRRQVRIDLDGAWFVAVAAARRLVALRRPGRIVFIGSWAGDRPHPHIPAYAAAKAGVRMVARCLASDLAPHGVLVNEVAPGYVDAGLSGRMFAADPAVRAAATREVPIGALSSAQHVADQVAWLCDRANDQMTGATLVIDGGLSLVGPAAPTVRGDPA